MKTRYAIMSVNDGLVGQAGITNTPRKLEYISARTTFNGVTITPNTDRISVKVQGAHLVFASVTLKHEATDGLDVFTVALYRNGAATVFMGATTLVAGSEDVSNIAFFGLMELEANDVLELFIFSDSAGPATITVADSQFGILSA